MREQARAGYTFIEVLIALLLILVATGAGYLAIMQSLQYMSISRDIRHALIDAQGILEEIQAIPPAQLFDRYPHYAEVTAPGQALSDEKITVEYQPGRVSSVLNDGTNAMQFSYAGPAGGAYQVSGAVLRVTNSDDTFAEFAGTASGITVNETTAQTSMFDNVVLSAFSGNARVELFVTLQGVNGPGDAVIFLNHRGPYTPGPEFFGGGTVTSKIFLPDLRPLHMKISNTWKTRGRELERALTGARIW